MDKEASMYFLGSKDCSRWNEYHERAELFPRRGRRSSCVLVCYGCRTETTNVIFSFEEGEGEYADTDLEADNFRDH